MRSIWKGAIGFGLVTVPVRLYSATEERDVSFHQVRRADGSRIRYRRVAEADGEEVPYSEIAKGYVLASGETVVLTDDDLADLPLTTSRVIDVLGFVPLEQVDPIYFAKSYYLEPEQQGVKPYVLLRDALESSGRVALVKVALRQRETLATLRVRDGVFVLETMLWPDEIRTPDFPFVDEEVQVRAQELAMAGTLIESLATDFDPGQYTDAYREALQAVIDAKVAGREVVEPAVPDAAPQGQVVDLMAALRESVEQARRSRGEDASPEGAANGNGAGPATAAASGGGAKAPSAAARKQAATATSGRGQGSAKSAAAKSAGGKSAAGKSAAAKSAGGKSAAGNGAAAAGPRSAPAKKPAAAGSRRTRRTA